MAGKNHMAANRYLVWRAATSVNWMTTAKDIARETGIHHDTVYRIINAAGWKLRGTRDPDESSPREVDAYMQRIP